MILPEISIRRPVLATMMSLALVLFGIVALQELPVRELPDVDPPIVNVTTVYPGANARVIETEVTERVEEAVNGIQGIKTITSESREELSSISLEFFLTRDIDLAAQDVRDRVARIRGQLPEGVEEPIIAKQDSDARPMMWVALFSDRYSTLELTDIAENLLKDPLQTVPGVSSIILGGEKRYAIRLRLDSERMAAREVTVLDIAQALQEQNVELPSGRVENLERELSIETQGELKTPEEFNQLVVKRDETTLVRLADIGYAEAGVEDERSIARYNSRPAVGLGIIRQSKANTISVAHGIKDELTRLGKIMPPGIEAVIAYDESVYVEKAINEVWLTLGIAFVLVVVTIFVFLRSPASTFIPAATIPISTIATFGVLWMMGYSINILTMLALVLAIGLVVDDSIVVLENIYRHIENGETPMKAAFNAMKEISFAVIATTLALIAVLLPLAYQKSITGRLFIEFAISLCGAVIISTFVALTLTPSLSARILPPSRKTEHGRMFLALERFFVAATNTYERHLRWALCHRAVVVGAAVFSFFLGVLLYLNLDTEFLPDEDKGWLFSIAITPEGATAEYTDRMVKKMEEIIQPLPEVEGFFSAVALARGGPGKANEGLMFVRFTEQRQKNVRDIVGGPRGVGARFFGDVEGALAIPIIPKAIGGGFGQEFQLVLKHQDLETLNSLAEKFVQELQQGGYLQNIRSAFEFNKPQLNVQVDRDRAASLGVSIESIARTLQILFGGEDLSRIKVGGEEYKVIVQLERERRLVPQDLERLYVRSAGGKLIQLNNVVSYETMAGPNAIFHHNRLRSATIEGTPQGVTLGTAVDKVQDLLEARRQTGLRYDWEGEASSLIEARGDTTLVLLLAITVIYMVLAAQFESFVHPLTVMLTLPLSALGAFGGLWLLSAINQLGSGLYAWANYSPEPPAIADLLASLVPRLPGMTINLFSQIGIVLLLGLVTKNAILLVDFANQEMARGAAAREAMIRAGLIRLRPILMTALATITGILPVAIGFGAGAESRRPMGVAVVGGMLTSTFLTLLVVPVMYTIFDDLKHWRHKKREKGAATFSAKTLLVLCLSLSLFVYTSYAEQTAVPPISDKPPDTSTLTLKRSLEIALRQNLRIKNAKEEIAGRYGTVVEARANLLPSLTTSAQYELTDEDLVPSFSGDNFGSDKDWRSRIQIEQSLYSGGGDLARFEQSKLSRRAAEYALAQVINEVLLEVRERFFALLLARAQLEVAQRSLELLEEELRSEQDKFKAGTVSEFNVLRAEVEVANSRTPLIRARNSVKLAREELSRVLSVADEPGAELLRDYHIKGQLTFRSFHVGLEDALASASSHRPELKQLELLVAAADRGVRVEWADYLPKISLYAGYRLEKSPFSDNFDDTLDGWAVGAEANWKLFDSLATKGRVDQAKADLNQARLQLKQMKLDIEVEIRRVHSSLIESKELVKASSKVVERAKESLRLARNRFKAGVATQLDVLDARVSLTEAATNKVQALHDYNLVIARMLKAMGLGGVAE